MAEEIDKGASLGSRRFRLPKLFAETEETETQAAEEAQPAAPPVNYPTASTPVTEVAPAGVSPVAPAAPAPTAASVPQAAPVPHAAPAPQAAPAPAESGLILEYVASMAQELLTLRSTMEQVNERVDEMNSRESTQEKVFNTLHAELSDYKNDFIYEHLKPVVRPLLFLYDSLEQFDGEIAVHERPEGEERRGVSPRLVRENISFFLDQLVEALRVCEVTQMDRPEGQFNAKLQKAIAVVPVEAAQNNVIQRVVRSGWYLNGQLLRPAEVVIGKAK